MASITRAIPDFELVAVVAYKPWNGEEPLIDLFVTNEEGEGEANVSLTIAEAAQLVTLLQNELEQAVKLS